MYQVLDTLVNDVKELVKCVKTFVQGKMPTNLTEDSTSPAVNHTPRVIGPNSVMEGKAPKLSIFSREEFPAKHKNLCKERIFSKVITEGLLWGAN